MRFIIEGEPKSKAKARVKASWPGVISQNIYYQEHILMSFITEMQLPIDTYESAFKMQIKALYKSPVCLFKSSVNNLTEVNRSPHKALDDLAKLICDTLRKIAYKDEKQIQSVTIKKAYSRKPRVEVEIIKIE